MKLVFLIVFIDLEDFSSTEQDVLLEMTLSKLFLHVVFGD